MLVRSPERQHDDAPRTTVDHLTAEIGCNADELAGVEVALLAFDDQDQLAFLGRGVGSVVPYIVMIAILLVRPSGLFGTRELTRV